MRIKVFYHESVEDLDRKRRNIVKKEVSIFRVNILYNRDMFCASPDAVCHLSRVALEPVLQVVPAAVSYWERVLKVRRNDAVIHLHRKCKNNQYFVAPDDPTQFCKEECVLTKWVEDSIPYTALL